MIEDPNSFRALCHVPRNLDAKSLPLPLLIYLHGAGENGASKDVWAVAASKHKTEGTPPELLSCGTATADLADGFIVIAPHSKRGWIREVTAANRAEPLLRFMDFLAVRMGVPGSGVPTFDTQRVYVTGHSDGATAALKAATTGRFAACLAVSCGGGVEATQLRGVPVWLFHGANDVILPVRCSDTLVAPVFLQCHAIPGTYPGHTASPQRCSKSTERQHSRCSVSSTFAIRSPSLTFPMPLPGGPG